MNCNNNNNEMCNLLLEGVANTFCCFTSEDKELHPASNFIVGLDFSALEVNSFVF